MKWITILLLLAGANLAHAIGGKQPVAASMKWKEECGSCHVAYPPELLTANDWQSLMTRLDKHFGVNAMLDARDSREIFGFLKLHGGSDARWSSTSLRISDTPWFRHEHRMISAQEWTRSEVKSRSNCSACHGRRILGNQE